MTTDQLERAQAIRRQINAYKDNYPDYSDYGSGQSFVVNASRVPAEVYAVLRKAYEVALDARVAALQSEFEAL